ncbi:MAG: uL22 family ribosomal protein, partial [Halobacteria archaeon]|nr:uL22 family ribosomal protein [Halobacteria archaeon]
PLKSHNSGAGHRKNLDGWDAGSYPEKASRNILDVLVNAEGNAEHAGEDPDNLYIYHIAAHKVDEAQGMKP